MLVGAGDADVVGDDAIKTVASLAGVPLGSEDMLAFDRDSLCGPARVVSTMLNNRAGFDKPSFDAAMADLTSALAAMDAKLGDAPRAPDAPATLADVSTVCTLYPAMAKALDTKARARRCPTSWRISSPSPPTPPSPASWASPPWRRR